MISGLNSTSYEGKLHELGLSTLKERLDRFDMVETYKIIKGINRVDHSQWVTPLKDTNLRQTRNRQCPNLITSTLMYDDTFSLTEYATHGTNYQIRCIISEQVQKTIHKMV